MCDLHIVTLFQCPHVNVVLYFSQSSAVEIGVYFMGILFKLSKTARKKKQSHAISYPQIVK